MTAKKLEFFKRFLTTTGTTYDDVARIVGITNVSVSRWFTIDDIKLSHMIKVVESLGYSFDISLRKEPNATDPPVEKLGRMAKQYEEDHLRFLCVAMSRYGITMADIARELRVYYTTIRHMFEVNDILFSRLIEIAEAFDLYIILDIHPLKTIVPNEDNECLMKCTVIPQVIQFRPDDY